MNLITRSDDERLNERLQASLTWSDDVLIRVTRDSLRAALSRCEAAEAALERVQGVIDECGCHKGMRYEYVEGLAVAEHECPYCRDYRAAIRSRGAS